MSGELLAIVSSTCALGGTLIGIGISWGTIGTKLSALKEQNTKDHESIMTELWALRGLEVRVGKLEQWRDDTGRFHRVPRPSEG